MLAITIKQPWATAIVLGLKPIENRTWTTRHRGPLFIHAGKSVDPKGFEFIEAMGLFLPDDLPMGGIIGRVELVDVHKNHPSPWAAPGHFHWELDNARPTRFRPTRGKLGLWTGF